MKSRKYTKIIRFISIICIFTTLIFCGCNQKNEINLDIQSQETKLSSLQEDLIFYQGIYDKAVSTYKQYKNHEGEPEWDSELSRIKKTIDETNTKINSIKREIVLIEKYLNTHQ